LNKSDQIKTDLTSLADAEKAVFLPKFFQAFPGGYGEGDRFIGVTVPHQRQIARQHYRSTLLSELDSLIGDPVHEYRLTAVFIMVLKYEKAKTEAEKQAVVNYYLGNIRHINNWDLVDSSAYKILGAHLYNTGREMLFDLARSNHLWQQRISVIATYYFIRKGDFNDTLKLAEMLLEHEHDLIHKAVGWMLREIGNRDFDAEYRFLKTHYRKMPRTMLRYAIEKFDPVLRKEFLAGLI
jgi:3-methyladenine DNA glycosylase AlkD